MCAVGGVPVVVVAAAVVVVVCVCAVRRVHVCGDIVLLAHSANRAPR